MLYFHPWILAPALLIATTLVVDGKKNIRIDGDPLFCSLKVRQCLEEKTRGGSPSVLECESRSKSKYQCTPQLMRQNIPDDVLKKYNLNPSWRPGSRGMMDYEEEDADLAKEYDTDPWNLSL